MKKQTKEGLSEGSGARRQDALNVSRDRVTCLHWLVRSAGTSIRSPAGTLKHLEVTSKRLRSDIEVLF